MFGGFSYTWGRLTLLGKFVVSIFFIGVVSAFSLIVFPPAGVKVTVPIISPELVETASVPYHNGSFEGTVFANNAIKMVDRIDEGEVRDYLVIENGGAAVFVEKTADVPIGSRIVASGLVDDKYIFDVPRVVNSSIEILNNSYNIDAPVQLSLSSNFSDFVGRYAVIRNSSFQRMAEHNLGNGAPLPEIYAYIPYNLTTFSLRNNTYYDFYGFVIKLLEYGNQLWFYVTNIGDVYAGG